ncbi:hypothetical protein VB735_13545 [Halotia wernerae UHCC 0503]|nr:hypothetical protein [Halotia wernerae UHCC 0503]
MKQRVLRRVVPSPQTEKYFCKEITTIYGSGLLSSYLGTGWDGLHITKRWRPRFGFNAIA